MSLNLFVEKFSFWNQKNWTISGKNICTYISNGT
jgi:hypothetical protein